jgi:cobalt-zinc-cadmium resistance protein CzcA
MRFNELMTGAKQDVVCKVYGDNMDTLAKIAKVIGHNVSSIDGAKDIYVEQVVGQPQVLVTLNRDKMKIMGLRTDEINKLVEASFSGAVAGKIYEGERPFDLVVRIDEVNRNSVEDIREMPITLDNGDVIPLSSVAEVKLINGPNQIQRENAQRRIMIGFNVRGRDVESVVKDLQLKLKKFALPTGYWIQYGGSFENLQRARTRLMLAIPAALLLICILLYFAFNSIAIAVLVFSAIPLSLIGGIVGLVLRDMPFSISAGIGMIALFGVAVLNGIVLVAEFKRQELENPNLDRESLIIDDGLGSGTWIFANGIKHWCGRRGSKTISHRGNWRAYYGYFINAVATSFDVFAHINKEFIKKGIQWWKFGICEYFFCRFNRVINHFYGFLFHRICCCKGIWCFATDRKKFKGWCNGG